MLIRCCIIAILVRSLTPLSWYVANNLDTHSSDPALVEANEYDLHVAVLSSRAAKLDTMNTHLTSAHAIHEHHKGCTLYGPSLVPELLAKYFETS
jgi:hypothetical protein